MYCVYTLRNLLKLTIIFVNAKVCSWQPWPSSTSPSKSLPSSTWSLFLQLTTLNAAVKAAGLEATLASPGKLDFEINIADMRTSFFNTRNHLLKSSYIGRIEKWLSIQRELIALWLSFSFAGPFTVFAPRELMALSLSFSFPGPFTVFAPTNLAFEKIPSADLQVIPLCDILWMWFQSLI